MLVSKYNYVMRKAILLLIPLLLWGCEKTYEDLIDTGTDFYQVSTIAGIKDTIDLKNPPDSLLNLRLIFTPQSQVYAAYFDVYNSENSRLNSEPVKMYKIIENLYENQFTLKREFPIGNYTVRFSAEGYEGNLKQVAVGNFYFKNGQDNLPPVISNLVIPDTIAKGVTFIFTVTASDSNGLNDIRYVYFELYRPDGSVVQNPPGSGNTLILMDDTGDFEHYGDEIAGDGIYSFKNFFLNDPSTQTGAWRFEFQARDRIGDLSNKIIHYMEVQ
jgi:hypothetical protein